MNANPPPVPAAGPVDPAPAVQPIDETRLNRLFRRSLRAGRIHPLQHLIRRHREEATA